MSPLGSGGLAALAIVALAASLRPHRTRRVPHRPSGGVTTPARRRGEGAGLRAHVARLRPDRASARRVAAALPDAVDLLLLASSAGLTLPLAHELVAPRVPSPVGEALVAAGDEASRGRPRADALVSALTPLGDRAAGVAHALADHLRYGTPLVPTLERLSAELRLDRRRRAEQTARRVPVRLLAPLITCVLPAFALLTVVPLLAASLQQLPT